MFGLMWVIALVNIFSMRHIMKLSKPLKKQGIQSNQYLLTWYTVFSLLAALCFSCYLAAYVVFTLRPPTHDGIKKEQIASWSCYIAFNLFMGGLDYVMLVLFMKFANQIREMALQHLAESLENEYGSSS